MYSRLRTYTYSMTSSPITKAKFVSSTRSATQKIDGQIWVDTTIKQEAENRGYTPNYNHRECFKAGEPATPKWAAFATLLGKLYVIPNWVQEHFWESENREVFLERYDSVSEFDDSIDGPRENYTHLGDWDI